MDPCLRNGLLPVCADNGFRALTSNQGYQIAVILMLCHELALHEPGLVYSLELAKLGELEQDWPSQCASTGGSGAQTGALRAGRHEGPRASSGSRLQSAGSAGAGHAWHEAHRETMRHLFDE